LFDNTYQRYLIGVFRDRLPFQDVPINLQLRDKRRDAGDAEDEPESQAVKGKKPARLGRSGPRGKKRGPAELWDDV
jgi:hypothetical protein